MATLLQEKGFPQKMHYGTNSRTLLIMLVFIKGNYLESNYM